MNITKILAQALTKFEKNGLINIPPEELTGNLS
jgi:hypothetical protein